MLSTSVLIPDAHREHGQSLHLMTMAGSMIVAKKPTRVILMGDFSTVDSLSAWDMKKSLKMEGRRYQNDITATKKALNALFAPLVTLQQKQRDWKEKIYRPEIIYIMGNHEDRVARYVENHAHMEGHIDFVNDVGLTESGFTVVPYGEIIERDGINFAHCILDAAGKSPAGKYAIQRVAEMCSKPTIIGHLHRHEVANTKRHGAGLMQILSCGCYFEGEPSYAKNANNSYYRGCWEVFHGKTGFDAQPYSIEMMKELYK